MRYVSTRGGGEPVSFEAAIGAGYAPDGGLYVPETLPPITAEDLDAWRTLDLPPSPWKSCCRSSTVKCRGRSSQNY